MPNSFAGSAEPLSPDPAGPTMSLTSRLTLLGPESAEPEDFLADSIGVIFPDDCINQHGDSQHALSWRSPHLPEPLQIQLADPTAEQDRLLFGHFLWNASLQLAEFVEAASLDLELLQPLSAFAGTTVHDFDIRGLLTIELGSGTALPSLVAALLGAKNVVITDYPAAPLMEILRRNVSHNSQSAFSPSKTVAPVTVDGHEWGELQSTFAIENKTAFDRVFVCDCLWMPWQHDSLRKSIAHFMKEGGESRAWVIGGFHTGRPVVCAFFEEAALAKAGLEIERIWERDIDGVEREWAPERAEGISWRKRWLAIGILRRALIKGGEGS